MLDVALTFLVKDLNEYLQARAGAAIGQVELGRLVDDHGKVAVKDNTIRAALVNIEEERIVKAQVPETAYVDGRLVALEPPLKLYLHVLFAANFQSYDEGLKFLALVLAYFQSHRAFTPDRYPRLDPRIELLAADLQSLTFEQLNQLWAFVGGRQLPSAVYKVRLVTVQDRELPSVGPPIMQISTRIGSR
jgi:hypothetical protein